jgi:hypothetical protein
MADLPNDIPASVQLIDPATGQPTVTLAQWIQSVTRALRDYETRITDLEP